MRTPATDRDVFGLVKPALDAHTLGLSSVTQLLEDCGLRVAVGDAEVGEAVGSPRDPRSIDVLERWLRAKRVTRLGFSYRLDATDAADMFGRWVHNLKARRLITAAADSPIQAVLFAGLPDACAAVKREHGDLVTVFDGDETPRETMMLLNVPEQLWPREIEQGAAYDEARMRFGWDVVRSDAHTDLRPVDRAGYPEYGTRRDSLSARLRDRRRRGLPPLLRAHMGPYLSDRAAALSLFYDWVRQVAASGQLDILSIGTSQLTQSAFGEDWDDRPNGGGVPLNSADEYRATWLAARPMLVRTYAGTRDVLALARMHEETIHIAWHALSMWWFSQLDGRGPNSVRDNLHQHVATLRYIASVGTPFEPNVPHHFGFRGCDDVTYVVSGVLAARTAKACGIRHLVLQIMLNTPRATWGVQDLAKARALLALVRELEGRDFRVTLQPRAGLDYFSNDLQKARAQLAAVTALMDDIEPDDPNSPEVIHVVSFSEADHLADPSAVIESAQLTRAALERHRALRVRGEVADMASDSDVIPRTQSLLDGARAILAEIERSVPNPYSAEGLYLILAAGFLPIPYLWSCREEFSRATAWRTRLRNGGMSVVDETGATVDPARRAAEAAWACRDIK